MTNQLSGPIKTIAKRLKNSVPNGLLTVVHAGFFLQFVCVLLVLGKVYSLERCHGCAIVISDGADMESSLVW